MPLPKRLGIIAAALALVTTPLAAAADTQKEESTNGPETCITKEADGSVRVLEPGDCAQFGKEGPGPDAQMPRLEMSSSLLVTAWANRK